ncbi:MAG: hypothetical protein AAGA30_04625, partial [Planctomycetota bacterium]
VTLIICSGGFHQTNATAATILPNMHPVSVIEADVFVSKFKTTMKLKCFAEDLEILQGVEALDDGFYDLDELRDATQDHAKFLADKIHLIGTDGNHYEAKIVEVVDFEVPDGQIRQGELMKYTIGVVLEYQYDETPEFLTINQQVIAEGLLLPSELKIILKQDGSDEAFFKMMKPDQPFTFRFDWTNPLPNSNTSEEDRESWFEEQRKKTLGIASYSSVYSFIYITNYEVRHEVLIPLATLNTFFDIQREDESFLKIPEQDIVAEQVKRLFSIGNPVEIDNIQVNPVFDRIDFYGLDLRDFAIRAERRKVSMVNGRVGIIMSYSTKSIPSQVKVTWDKFNDSLRTVDSVVFAFDEVSKAEFSMFLEDNTYVWNSDDRKPPAPVTEIIADESFLPPEPLTIPWASILLAVASVLLLLRAVLTRKFVTELLVTFFFLAAGVLAWPYLKMEVQNFLEEAQQIETAEAEGVFRQLHQNMFRAFDYHSESDIYDALARSVDGPLLRDLYLQINESLRVSEQGGAIAKIERVNYLNGDFLPLENEDNQIPKFRFRSQWELMGTVEHWGHIHERKNDYDAEFTIELVGNDWKIVEMDVVDFAHGPVKTRVRKL